MNKFVIKAVTKHAIMTGVAAVLGTVVVDLVTIALSVPPTEEGS